MFKIWPRVFWFVSNEQDAANSSAVVGMNSRQPHPTDLPLPATPNTSAYLEFNRRMWEKQSRNNPIWPPRTIHVWRRPRGLLATPCPGRPSRTAPPGRGVLCWQNFAPALGAAQHGGPRSATARAARRSIKTSRAPRETVSFEIRNSEGAKAEGVGYQRAGCQVPSPPPSRPPALEPTPEKHAHFLNNAAPFVAVVIERVHVALLPVLEGDR
jgi:hypothetical protein